MVVDVCCKRKQTMATRKDREHITKYESLTFCINHTEFWQCFWYFCYDFDLGKIFVGSNNMKRMPERGSKCIPFLNLIPKECFVPEALFSTPEFFFFFFVLRPYYLLELQVFQFKEMNPQRIHTQCRLNGIQARQGLYNKIKPLWISHRWQPMSEIK